MKDHQTRELLRHLIATLAYRTHRAIDDAPPGFADLSLGQAVRTPLEILQHMSHLIYYAIERFGNTNRIPKADWNAEIERFDSALELLDKELVSDQALQGSVGNNQPITFERLMQGPLTDALTHAGQLTLMRRLAGAPIEGENYIAADITVGKFRP